MVKQSKRRHHKHREKTKKPSKNDRRKSKRPDHKKKKKEKSKPVIEARSIPVVIPKKRRRRRRNEWKAQMKKKVVKKKYCPWMKEEWFWGMLSQTEAEEYLKEGNPGDFLVRSMLYQETTAVIISVISEEKARKILHLRINSKGFLWNVENFELYHKTIINLVKYYGENYIGMYKARCGNPIKPPDWFIKSYKIMSPKNAVILGSGNFSAVVVGVFRRRLVAVKILTSQGDRLLIDREMLMKEATIMSKLQHPYITKMVGVSIDQSPPMLLVEMMATSLLGHLEKYGKYTTIAEKLLYCWQMASGLAFMSSKGIVHRDVAARNALFSPYGILKLADFGLSDFEIKLTTVNTAKDHLPIAWFSPEALGDRTKAATFNEKTDVWMFGVACTEIFNNGKSPSENIGDKIREKVTRYKDGDVLHKFSKYTPQDIQDYFKKTWMLKPSERPSFAEIVIIIDQWLKIRYTLPPLKQRTVQMIKNCNPLTNAEYEILYYNNWDWMPAARKVKIKRTKEEKSSKKSGKKGVKRNPRDQLRYLKKKLINRRKRNRMRIKLRWWRVKRREEKRRIKALRNYDKLYSLKKSHRTNGYKKVVAKYEKLVELYRKMMMVKWRKRAPTRKTRFRLRRRRLINRMSKHPESRNGRTNRFVNKKREELKKKSKPFVRPVMPQLPKFVPKKQNKKKKKASIRGKNKAKTPKKGGSDNETPLAVEKRKRKIRKRKRHNLRKRNKRKHRKRHHKKRRQRRRRKHRRRYRKTRMELKRNALTVDQKERLRSLTKRRDEQLKSENRMRRNAKIGKILRDWRVLRRCFIYIRKEKLMKRIAERKKREMKLNKGKDKVKDKTARTGRRKSKNKAKN